MPRVSVIIPTYNREGVLRRAMDSVLNQTFRDFDLWVVDDGSIDGTERLVTEIAGDSAERTDSFRTKDNLKRIHYLKTPNRGVAAARNLGINKSSGEWIALLDSDDEWRPGKLERQLAFAEAHPEYQLIHTDEIWIRGGIRVNPPENYQKYGGDVFLRCLPLCMISPSTSMFTPEVFRDAGEFDEEFPVCEDYDFWLKICSLMPAGFVDSPLTIKYGGHSDQLSTSRPALDYWRIRSLCRIVKIRSLVPEWEQAVHGEIVRKGRILLKGYRKYGREEEYREVITLIRAVYPDFQDDGM